MNSLEHKLKTTTFWFYLGSANHLIALAVVLIGCALSGFSCQGERMAETLSIYTFTLLTPQIASEVIILIALFLVSGTALNKKNGWAPAMLFAFTLGLAVLLGYWLS